MNLKRIGRAIAKCGPGILTGIGILGMGSAIAMGITVTPTAVIIREQKAAELKVEPKDLPPVEVVKSVGKLYIPTVITALLSAALIIEGQRISHRRHAALAAAYGLSEAALKEFQEKIIEMDGEKKLATVKKAVLKDKVAKNPVENKEVVITRKGETLCYEPISGRYFQSDIDQIKRAVNTANNFLVREGILTLNEFYYEIGLDPTRNGNNLGWALSRDDLIDLDFTSTLASDGTPCLVIDYRKEPNYDFDKY